MKEFKGKITSSFTNYLHNEVGISLRIEIKGVGLLDKLIENQNFFWLLKDELRETLDFFPDFFSCLFVVNFIKFA